MRQSIMDTYKELKAVRDGSQLANTISNAMPYGYGVH